MGLLMGCALGHQDAVQTSLPMPRYSGRGQSTIPSVLSFITEESLKLELSNKLHALEEVIGEPLHSHTPLVALIGTHILSHGKRIRPLLLMLSAKASGYLGAEDVGLARIIEWIHAATLLHDDVLDEADLRRQKPTVRAKWGNRASVTMGDYAYFNAVQSLTRMANPELTACVLNACHRMAFGELTQFQQCGHMMRESTYLRIIRDKTGALIGATCQAGGILARAQKDECQALRRFGLALGMGYQLLDDALDYVAPRDYGKRKGQDFHRGLVTMPLLHLLRNCSEEESEQLQTTWLAKTVGSEDALGSVGRLLKHYGSIEYTFALVDRYCDVAKRHLVGLTDSVYKDALLRLADVGFAPR